MRIAIIGTGHMGSYLARELKEHELALYNRTAEKAKKLAEELNAIHMHCLDELKAFEPELVINAVSLQNTIKVFEEIEKHCNAAFCDVASIKQNLPSYYSKRKGEFLSLHPMFGPTFSNVENLSDENVVIIKESTPKWKKFFRKFFEERGLNIFEYSFEEHDKMMAYSLALPFISTLVFASCMNFTTVPGTTFKKHLKIAKGLLSEDSHLLSEILLNPHAFKEIEKVTNNLHFLKRVMEARDYEIMKEYIEKLRKKIKN